MTPSLVLVLALGGCDSAPPGQHLEDTEAFSEEDIAEAEAACDDGDCPAWVEEAAAEVASTLGEDKVGYLEALWDEGDATFEQLAADPIVLEAGIATVDVLLASELLADPNATAKGNDDSPDGEIWEEFVRYLMELRSLPVVDTVLSALKAADAWAKSTGASIQAGLTALKTSLQAAKAGAVEFADAALAAAYGLLPSTCDAAPVTIEVGSGAVTRTGIVLAAGTVVSTQATGTWCWGGDSDCSDADGTSGRPNSEEGEGLLPGANLGELIGQYDDSWFELGESANFVATAEGELSLRMNDLAGAYGDNSGSISVDVRVCPQ